MDLRGYGASDKTPRGYDPQTTAFDVTGVIKSLGFSSGVVVGHDWGGMAAWATTAYAPVPVRALISVAAPHPLAFPWRAIFALLAFFQVPLFPERASWPTTGCYIEELLRSRAADGRGFLTSAEARHYRDALDAVAEPALRPGVPADVRSQSLRVHGPRLPSRAAATTSHTAAVHSWPGGSAAFRCPRWLPPSAGSTPGTTWSACPVSAICRTRRIRTS